MLHFIWSTIVSGVLYDIIKGGAKITKEYINQKFLKWNISEEDIQILYDILINITEQNISSKHELKKWLEQNRECQEIFGIKAIIQRELFKCSQSKIIRAFMCIVFIFVIISSGYAIYNYINEKNTKYWDGDISNSNNYGGGSGTVEDPYIIKQPNELAELACIVNSGIDYKNTYFKLGNDIYLNAENNEAFVELPNNNVAIPISNMHSWIPIGDAKHPFSGYFDGNNKTILGLYINEKNNYSYKGLFGYCTEESQILNLTIQNVVIKGIGGSYIGGIGGRIDGLVNNCFVERAWIYGEFFVGGITGNGNVIVNCGSSAYIVDTYNYRKNEITINENTLLNKGYFGGISGKCNYLINSVSYARIINPTYCVGGLAGEIVFDMYNCVCSGILVDWNDRNFNKYFEYLYNNKLEFLYSDVIGLFDGQGNNIVDEHCIYIMDENSGIYTTFLDIEERNIFEDKFLSLYSNVKFDHYENSNMLGVHCGIINHDYSSNTQQYNTISENINYLEHEDEVIKKINSNIEIYDGALYNSDIRDILNQYGVAGGLLELKKWVCSEIHGIPTLEGMNMDSILYSKIS